MYKLLIIYALLLMPVSIFSQNNFNDSLVNDIKKGQAFYSDTLIKHDSSYYNMMLIEASFEGNIQKLNQALKNGADVNTKTSEGVTPLMFASQNGFIEIVQTLFINGADVNIKPNDGTTALIAASRFNHYEVMDKLVLAGADLNAKDNNGVSSLLYAAAYGYFIPSDLLLFYGADINTCSSDSINALFASALNGNYNTAELFIKKGININSTDKNKWTPLMASVFSGSDSITRLLLNHGAIINAVNKEGYTALAIAAEKNQYQISDMLLAAGADPNIKINNISLKKVALYFNSSEVYKQLQKSNAEKEVFPFIDALRVSIPEIILNNKDFLCGISTGISDKRSQITLSVGFSKRLWLNRILTDYGNNIFYQFREKRYILNIGFEKSFTISNYKNKKQEVFINMKEVYTYGKYRGSTQKPDDKFIFFPSAGFRVSGNKGAVNIAIGYLKTGVLKENPVYLTMGYFFKIPLIKYSSLKKQILWL